MFRIVCIKTGVIVWSDVSFQEAIDELVILNETYPEQYRIEAQS